VAAYILENEGYQMVFAQNGSDALSLIKTEPFDLILLDIIMPGMDGFEICKRLRENPETRDIPILFLTSIADSDSLVRGFKVGAMDYVTKPFNEAELLARVKTHLELSRSREELKQINEQLSREIVERKQAERRYRDMYRNAVQGMFQSNFSGKLIRLNPSYASILGYQSPQEALAAGDSVCECCDDPADFEKMGAALKKRGVLTNYELQIRRRDGTPAWLLLNVRLAEDDAGEVFIEGIAIDNTEKKLAEEELRRSEMKFRYLAVHDNLTGLYNTRYLYESLEKLIASSAADHRPFSLIFMDMDNFKRVVDTYGHLNGSRALQEVGGTIRDSLSEPAYGVAYGGDEFVIVLPGFDRARAVEKAEEIRLRMSRTDYLASQGHHVRLRASFGISAYPDDAADMTGLLTLADRAMFGIKEKGKDAVGPGNHS
jgi:diguanylate cyclase (GGDEF)-like protein/PAS domain S-box-containing protein